MSVLKTVFVDLPYKENAPKFQVLIDYYKKIGYETFITEKVEDIVNVRHNPTEEIILFWHLSSSKWKQQIVAPSDIPIIVDQIRHIFTVKYAVTDSPNHESAARKTKWFDDVYGWQGFKNIFIKE